MKNILTMALILVGSTFYSAEAQRPACKAPDGKVCTKKGCYKTPYAHNFAVCKNESGYYICCEEPNDHNTTFSAMPIVRRTQYRSYDDQYSVQVNRTGNSSQEINDDLLAPQSQSYPRYSANNAVSYEGYYPSRKGKIRVCNNSDNVADANKAAYDGCPTPAYDGPDKNKNRNVNVSNPSSSFPQPPNSGNKQTK